MDGMLVIFRSQCSLGVLRNVILIYSRAQYSADWGDYISFAARMREKANTLGTDLLLIDTGDRIEGNGLYDASSPKGEFTSDIIKEQDIDVICIGNHELYQASSADREYSTTVPNFKDNYIASNLDIIDKNTGELIPLARRYRKFTTKNRGIRILALLSLAMFQRNQMSLTPYTRPSEARIGTHPSTSSAVTDISEITKSMTPRHMLLPLVDTWKPSASYQLMV
jgi:hypothetical protein